MDVYFTSEDLREACATERACKRRWGDQQAKVIGRRLAQLRAADSLDDMRAFAAAHAHELQGERAGQLAVNAQGALRIIFEPAHDPAPCKPDGGLDWRRITAIRILDIADYHRG